MSILVLCYRLLLWLYPRSFRDEFGAEMGAIFQEQMHDAAHSHRAVLQICWRELRDWPVHCVQVHWQARQQRLLMQSTAPSSWWDTAVACSPYFLFALFLSGSVFIFLFGQPSGLFFFLVSGYGFVFVLLFALIIAWWRGWPNWSAARVIGRVSSRLPAPPQPAAAKEMAMTVTAPTHNTMTRRQGFYLAAGLLLLLALLLPTTTLAHLFPNDEGDPLALATAFPLFLMQTIGLIVVAILLASSVHRWQAGGHKTAVLFGSLSLLLLVTAVRQFYWLTVWDNTDDPLGYFWLFIPILGIFFATIWLAIALPHKAKWMSALYLLFVPTLLILVSVYAQRVDFRQLTESRAERVDQAIAAYHAQHGRYPENLHQLTPRYLLALSEPVIIFGQDWCYDGDADHYRLGYVYREHWSDPRLVGRVYKSTYTATADLAPLCQQEITTLQARDPQYYGLRKE